jgi:hypothetical protein
LPERRHSVEQDLRRVRREIQPPVGHSVRNTVILILILLGAASLTVWVTQGIKEKETPSGRTPSTEGDPLFSDMNANTGRELEDASAESLATWPQSWPSEGSTPPALGVWPPVSLKAEQAAATAATARELFEPWGGNREPQTGEPIERPRQSARGAGIAIVPDNPVDNDSLTSTDTSEITNLQPAMDNPTSVEVQGSVPHEGPVASLLPIVPVGTVRR